MPDPASKAIFLSYARDDAAAARRIAEALRSAGLDVWFDENELRGGDSWDAKIRKQINDCALFMALISQHTDAREKGYFRLEWKLAVEQTHLLAEGVPFIAPVAIDDTRENGAVVPPEFLRVQWTRLPGALPTPQFVEQTKRLLHAPHKAVGPVVDRAPDHRSGRQTPRASGLLRWVIGVVAALAIAAAYFALRPASSPSTALTLSQSTSSPATEKSAAPVSEARQLVAKARVLYEPWDLATPGDFALAEQLLKKAVELDPTDGDTWAAYAVLSCGYAAMLEPTDTRRLAARAQAEKAIRLAPDLDQARFARAFSLRFDPQTQDEAIRLLRAEAARQPTNRFVVRILGAALRSVGQLEQSLVYFDKAAALPGNDPITHLLRGMSLERLWRFDEAEAAYDEALAAAPNYANAHWFKLNLLLDVHRDLARARAHLAKIPPDPVANEATAVNAYYMAMYLREPVKALGALRQANDYLTGYGPKAKLTALAHRMAQNEEAARSDFKAALRLVEERLAVRPNDVPLLANKAEILALQGDKTAAETLVREIRQRISAGDRSLDEQSLATLLMLVNQQEAALVALEAYYGKRSAEYRSKLGLRYDPVWEPLRGNPRFEALLKVPEQKK